MRCATGFESTKRAFPGSLLVPCNYHARLFRFMAMSGVQGIVQIWDEPVMKVTEIFDSDLPGQCRICSHKSVFDVTLCVCSLNAVCTTVLLHVS